MLIPKTYSIHLIDENGKDSYLSVKGRTQWKTKNIAVKHARTIMSCKNPPYNTVFIEIQDVYGFVVQVIK